MSSLHKKSLIATAAIFCCRFTGLLREIVYTAFFGATAALDAFLTAFRVPNMLRDMFAEGALSQSFTSVMSKTEKQEGSAAAWKLANQVVSQLVSLMLIIVGLGVLLSGLFIKSLYPERAVADFVEAPAMVATADMTQATAVYLGCETDADGIMHAKFKLNEPLYLDGAEKLKLNAARIRNREVGSEIKLSTASRPAKGYLQLESESFMEMAADLCRIMWPFILLASLSALCMGALNVFGVFGIPNLASAAFNLTTVGLGCLLGWIIDPSFGPNALYGFAIAVVFGGAAQVLVQVPALRRKGYRPKWHLGLSFKGGRLSFTNPAVRRIWVLMIPGVIAAGITQTQVFINTGFALYLPGGSVTALSGAFHLWQLPVALFGVAVGMVVLPSVSVMSLKRGNNEIPEHLAHAMRFVAFFAVPSAVLLGLWGTEIVSIFFQRGRFDAAASELMGQVLAAYCIGLLGYAGMKVLQPVFLALEKPWAPAGLALFACLISISLNYIAVRVLDLGVMWLAMTTAFVTTLNFFFYFFYLRHLLGSMACHILLPGLLRILGAGAVLALLCVLAKNYIFVGFLEWGFWARLAALAVAGIGAGIVYLAACFALRVPELTAFTRRFLRR